MTDHGLETYELAKPGHHHADLVRGDIPAVLPARRMDLRPPRMNDKNAPRRRSAAETDAPPGPRGIVPTSRQEHSGVTGPLARLTAASARYETGLRALSRELADEVMACRRAGATWGEIGERLGMTKQAAQKRWGRHVQDPPGSWDAVGTDTSDHLHGPLAR